MKQVKKIWMLLLAAVLAFSLAACGNEAAPAASSETSVTEQSETTDETDKDGKAEETDKAGESEGASEEEDGNKPGDLFPEETNEITTVIYKEDAALMLELLYGNM